VTAIAYDNPIPGFGTRNCNNLRLWAAKPSKEFDLEAFNTGDYVQAILAKQRAETLSSVLYPDDRWGGQRRRRALGVRARAWRAGSAGEGALCLLVLPPLWLSCLFRTGGGAGVFGWQARDFQQMAAGAAALQACLTAAPCQRAAPGPAAFRACGRKLLARCWPQHNDPTSSAVPSDDKLKAQRATKAARACCCRAGTTNIPPPPPASPALLAPPPPPLLHRRLPGERSPGGRPVTAVL
jgi:hypothetical protein